MYLSKASLLKARTSMEYLPSVTTKWLSRNLFNNSAHSLLCEYPSCLGCAKSTFFVSYCIAATSPSHFKSPSPTLEKTPSWPMDTPLSLSATSRSMDLDVSLVFFFSSLVRVTATLTAHADGRFSSAATLVYTKWVGTSTRLICCTVMSQSTGGILHVNNCSLGQVEENTLHSDGGSVLAEGVDDDLCFRGGDASLRFLLYTLKRHCRVLGMCDA